MKIVIFISLLFQFANSNALAERESHGGDDVEADALGTLGDISDWLNRYQKHFEFDVPFTAAEFKSWIQRVSIETVDDKLFATGDDRERVAVNFPKLRIIKINRELYRGISDARQKWRLLIHEMIFIMGKEEKKYEISSKIVDIAMPLPGALAKAFIGKSPWCFKVATEYVNMGGFYGIQFKEVGRKKFDVFFQIGRVELNDLKVEKEIKLASNIACNYSSYHSGAMKCKKSGMKEERVWVNVRHNLRSDSDPTPYNYYKFYFATKESKNIIDEMKFVLLDSYSAAPTLEPEEWETVKRGKFPIFKDQLTWSNKELFDRIGKASFFGILSLEFDQCLFL